MLIVLHGGHAFLMEKTQQKLSNKMLKVSSGAQDKYVK